MLFGERNYIASGPECQSLSRLLRQQNGCHIFTVIHIQQFRLARTAFQIEVWQDGLKKTAEVVKLSAKAILRMLQQLSKDPDADITLCPLPPFRDKKGQNLIPYKIQHCKAGMGGYRPFSGT